MLLGKQNQKNKSNYNQKKIETKEEPVKKQSSISNKPSIIKKQSQVKFKDNHLNSDNYEADKVRTFNYMNDKGLNNNDHSHLQILEQVNEKNNNQIDPSINNEYMNPAGQKQQYDQQQQTKNKRELNPQYEDTIDILKKQQNQKQTKQTNNEIFSYEQEYLNNINATRQIQEQQSFQQKYGYDRKNDVNIFDGFQQPKQQIRQDQDFKQKYGYDSKRQNNIFSYQQEVIDNRQKGNTTGNSFNSGQKSDKQSICQERSLASIKGNQIFSYENEVMQKNNEKELQRKMQKDQVGEFLGHNYQDSQNSSNSVLRNHRQMPKNNIYQQSDEVQVSTYQANNIRREQQILNRR